MNTDIRQPQTIQQKRRELHMPYVSYTSMKIVHDQKIQEALERQRLYAGQETQKQGLLQTFGKFLACFANRSGRKQAGPLPGCARACEGRAAAN